MPHDISLSNYLNNGLYVDNDFYTYNTIQMSLVNVYANWSRWRLEIINEELQNNINFQIYNQNKDSDLKIRFKSEDFNYSIFDKNSSSAIINNIEYPNNYITLHDRGLNDNVNITYNLWSPFDNNSDVNNIFSSIPNMLDGFKTSFIFLGTLITTFFTLISEEMSVYFIVLLSNIY